MKKPIFLSVFFIILLYGCSKNESNNCDTISGVYTGTMSGYPLKGTLKLIINLDQEDISSLTGTWSAENGLSGEINRLDVTCSTGNFEYDYGLSWCYRIRHMGCDKRLSHLISNHFNGFQALM